MPHAMPAEREPQRVSTMTPAAGTVPQRGEHTSEWPGVEKPTAVGYSTASGVWAGELDVLIQGENQAIMHVVPGRTKLEAGYSCLGDAKDFG